MSARGLSQPPPADPSAPPEEIDLDPAKQARISEVFGKLEDVTYYDLLGIPGDADRKKIKSAYYKLAPEFHPDTYFRKRLGPFKAQIEAIFARMTLAHDVLTSKDRRAQYDAYLGQTQQNRAIAAILDDGDASARAAQEAIENAARAEAAVEPLPPPPPLSADEKRALLARKLLGGAASRVAMRRREGQSTPPPPPSTQTPAEARAAASQVLRARYEAAKAEALRIQLERYKFLAKEALARDDFAAAATALRVGITLAPEDAALKREYEEVRKAAARLLAEGYVRQAQYEAEDGRWTDAALSYAKAVEGRPDDAKVHERAAHATLQAGGSTRRAVELARRAVELAPQPEHRATLARAYIAANLPVSAIAELDRAEQHAVTAPIDARLKASIAELRDQAQRLAKLG